MTIDLHILVSIVQLLVIALGGFGFVWTMRAKLDLLIQSTDMRHSENVKEFGVVKADIVAVNAQLTKLSDITIELTKQEARMVNYDQRLLELSKRINDHITVERKRSRA